MPVAEAREKYPGVYWSALAHGEPWAGGESPDEFLARVREAWRAFKEENKDRTVLLVTNGGVLNAVLCLENGTPWTNQETAYKVPPARTVVLP